MNRIVCALLAWLLATSALADGINIPPVPIQGTWVPAVTGASVAGTGQTYSAQVGSYEQNGRQVTARFTIAMTSIGTASGNLQLSLPVQAANVANDFGGCYVFGYSLNSATALNYGIMGTIAVNATIATFTTNANTSQIALTVANLGAIGTLQGVCNYRAS